MVFLPLTGGGGMPLGACLWSPQRLPICITAISAAAHPLESSKRLSRPCRMSRGPPKSFDASGGLLNSTVSIRKPEVLFKCLPQVSEHFWRSCMAPELRWVAVAVGRWHSAILAPGSKWARDTTGHNHMRREDSCKCKGKREWGGFARQHFQP